MNIFYASLRAFSVLIGVGVVGCAAVVSHVHYPPPAECPGWLVATGIVGFALALWPSIVDLVTSQLILIAIDEEEPT